MDGPASVTLAVLLLLAVVTVVLPSGRRMLSTLAGRILRWPGLVRAELRGAAPLRVDEPGRDVRWDTRPDIPVVTRALPVVERSERA